MARQFKIETLYVDGVSTTIYWHDNDKIEFAAPPPQVNTAVFNIRTNMIEVFINFCKEQAIKNVEITKLAIVEKTDEAVDTDSE